MKMFHRKSKWDRVMDPLTSGKPAAVVKSGLTAVGALVGVSLASAAVSAVRNKNSDA
jgi:hypothetical protein